MAYKNAKDNRHNASIAKMMSKVKNPNFSIDKKVEKKKKEEEEEEKEIQKRMDARSFKQER